jgi:hypothetical protein
LPSFPPLVAAKSFDVGCFIFFFAEWGAGGGRIERINLFCLCPEDIRCQSFVRNE